MIRMLRGARLPAGLAGLLCALLIAVDAAAQTYPAKPVKLVVGYPPGG